MGRPGRRPASFSAWRRSEVQGTREGDAACAFPKTMAQTVRTNRAINAQSLGIMRSLLRNDSFLACSGELSCISMSVQIEPGNVFIRFFFSALLTHTDRRLSRFRSYVPCGIESSVSFSTDRKRGHPEVPHGRFLDTMPCLSMPLQGRPRRNAGNDRRSFALSVIRMKFQCR